MPKFESPLGSKQFSNPPMKEFSIPDESGAPPQGARHRAPVIDNRVMQDFQDRMAGASPSPHVREMSDVEREIMAAKKAKREGKERLSDGARRRIEVLLGMTRLTRDIEVGGQHYSLKSLQDQELREALVATVEFDGTIQLVFETRKQLLARSLTVIAGVEISQFLNSDELDDRLSFIELMDHALLQRLYSEYVLLSNEAQERYALKTPAEVKEVVEDLKK